MTDQLDFQELSEEALRFSIEAYEANSPGIKHSSFHREIARVTPTLEKILVKNPFKQDIKRRSWDLKNVGYFPYKRRTKSMNTTQEGFLAVREHFMFQANQPITPTRENAAGRVSPANSEPGYFDFEECPESEEDTSPVLISQGSRKQYLNRYSACFIK